MYQKSCNYYFQNIIIMKFKTVHVLFHHLFTFSFTHYELCATCVNGPFEYFTYIISSRIKILSSYWSLSTMKPLNNLAPKRIVKAYIIREIAAMSSIQKWNVRGTITLLILISISQWPWLTSSFFPVMERRASWKVEGKSS